MLGKLIKHEWKGTYRMGCLMLGAMAVVTFLGWLSFQAPVWKSMNGGSQASFGWLDIFSMFTVMIYAMLLVCVTFGIKVYLGVRFYRTMYTDEGYLTHTLPATKNQILASKILVSGLWTLFILLSVYLSLLLLVCSMVWTVVPEGYLPADFFSAVWEMIGEMEAVFSFNASHFVGIWIIASLVAEQMLVSLFRSFATNIGIYLNINTDIRFLIDLLTAAALYGAMYFITSRKLNLA